MNVTVATLQDLATIRQIAIDTYVDTFAPYNTPANMEAFLQEAYAPEKLLAEMTGAESIYYLAWDGTVPVGYARVRYNDEAEDVLGRQTLELQRLYILPEHKGKKAGSALMNQTIGYAKEKNAEWLWLGVWERNFAAQKFYASWGFEKFGEHIFQMGDDPQIDWLLRKKL